MRIKRKRLSAAEKRLKILNEAVTQFLRLGYEGCTLDQISAGARVGKQAIYQFFDSKEQLYAEAVRQQIFLHSSDALSLDQPVDQAIEQYILSIVNRTSEPRIFGMMRVNIFAFRHLPLLSDELHENRRAGSLRMKIYLDALAQQGRIALFGIDTLNLATRVAGVATQGIRPFMGFGWPDAEDRAANAGWATHMFLETCRCDAGQKLHHAPIAAQTEEPMRPASMRLPEDRFSHLCATAIQSFLAHGFEGMSLDALVNLTGVSRATIYRHFRDKDGFFRFTVEREIHRMTHQPLATPEQSDFEDSLQRLAEDMLTDHVRADSLAMYRLLIEQGDRVPDLARLYYHGQVQRVREPLSALYHKHLGHLPCDQCLIAFHTLATFGVRFLTHLSPVTPAMIRKLSSETVTIMTRAFLQKPG